MPVILFVMVLAFLLMLVAFRSVTIAAVSVLLNLLSMSAAFGVMVAVFQHGWGASLVGGGDVGAIESWIPLFAFVILFGLSMDYHVFVVSRIREAHDRGLLHQRGGRARHQDLGRRRHQRRRDHGRGVRGLRARSR